MKETTIIPKTVVRLAGFLYLWLIATGLSGSILIARITSGGTITETAKKAIASEGLYRVGICLELVETLSVLLLAFLLYGMLRRVHQLTAHLALLWRFAESLIGIIGVIFGFVKLNLYTHGSPIEGDQERLVAFARYAGTAAYNIGALCFSIGSLLYFYLFFKSNYLPVFLSWLGIVSSVIVAVICFGNLLLPEYGKWFQYGWAPMAIAEIATGLWLLFRPSGKPPSRSR